MRWRFLVGLRGGSVSKILHSRVSTPRRSSNVQGLGFWVQGSGFWV
jgi:hypothetical protein